MTSFVQLSSISSGATFTLVSSETGYLARFATIVGTADVVLSTATTFATFTNYGDIVGTSDIVRTTGTGNFSVYNFGAITALSNNDFALGGNAPSVYTIVNDGTISGAIACNAPAIFDITNSGRIYGNISDLDTNLTSLFRLTNFGLISGTINAANNSATTGDVIINAGGTIDGNVFLRAGNDFYDGRGGKVIGTVDGSSGNDILVGGNEADKFFDTSGNNWIVGGGGDDEVTIANSGAANTSTTAWGGDANFSSDNSLNDTVNVNGSSSNIFLSGKVSDVATGALTAWIWGFENATGTASADSIIGTAGNNIIKGNGGADWLVGNGGFDQFVFVSVSSSNSTISGFSADLIDLHNMDPNTTISGDQAFLFKTVHTSNAAGELVFTNFGGGGQIELYTNADNTVDATIFISYAAGAAAPTASDFWL